MAITYRTTFAIALAACLAAASGVASADELHCEVNTDYDLTLNPRSLILIRDSGTPQRLVMRKGALFVMWR